jgi:hypothetical protein
MLVPLSSNHIQLRMMNQLQISTPNCNMNFVCKIRGIHQKTLNKQGRCNILKMFSLTIKLFFSFENLHLQSSTIVEGDFIVGLGICPYFSNSFSNQYLDSIIEEHIGDENDLKHSNIPMKLIRDVDLQLEEETLNLHPQIIPYLHERLDVCHASFELSTIQETNLDDCIMLKDLSPKESESIKEIEDECLENTIINYHSS